MAENKATPFILAGGGLIFLYLVYTTLAAPSAAGLTPSPIPTTGTLPAVPSMAGSTGYAGVMQAPPAPAPPAGVSVNDTRIQLLISAYNQAATGNTGPAGLGYIKAWVTDPTPHPVYSVTYAKTLLSVLASVGIQ